MELNTDLPMLGALLDTAAPLMIVFARVSGLFLLDPFFGSPIFPMRTRLAAAIAVTVGLLPVARAVLPTAGDLALDVIVALLFGELALGVLVGLALRVVIAAARFAGNLAGMQIGLRADAMADPMGSGGQSDVISNLSGIVALAFLIAVDAHHLVIRGLAETLVAVPPGVFTVRGEVAGAVSRLVEMVITVGVSFSMPVLAAVFLTQLGLAFLSRSVPQLNVFVVGFLVTITVGLAALAMNFDNAPEMLVGTLQRALGEVRGLVVR